MTSMVSAIRARGTVTTVTTASWISCSSRRSAPSAEPRGVQGPDAAWMAGAPGLQQVQRLSAADLTDGDSVGAQA